MCGGIRNTARSLLNRAIILPWLPLRRLNIVFGGFGMELGLVTQWPLSSEHILIVTFLEGFRELLFSTRWLLPNTQVAVSLATFECTLRGISGVVVPVQSLARRPLAIRWHPRIRRAAVESQLCLERFARNLADQSLAIICLFENLWTLQLYDPGSTIKLTMIHDFLTTSKLFHAIMALLGRS